MSQFVSKRSRISNHLQDKVAQVNKFIRENPFFMGYIRGLEIGSIFLVFEPIRAKADDADDLLRDVNRYYINQPGKIPTNALGEQYVPDVGEVNFLCLKDINTKAALREGWTATKAHTTEIWTFQVIKHCLIKTPKNLCRNGYKFLKKCISAKMVVILSGSFGLISGVLTMIIIRKNFDPSSEGTIRKLYLMAKRTLFRRSNKITKKDVAMAFILIR